MKVIETFWVSLIAAAAIVAAVLSVWTALPHPVPVHHHHVIPAVVVPDQNLSPVRDLKVPVTPAVPWLPFGQRGILA